MLRMFKDEREGQCSWGRTVRGRVVGGESVEWLESRGER